MLIEEYGENVHLNLAVLQLEYIGGK